MPAYNTETKPDVCDHNSDLAPRHHTDADLRHLTRPHPHAPSPHPTNFVTTAIAVISQASPTTFRSRKTERSNCMPMFTRRNGTRNSVTPLVKWCLLRLSSVASDNAVRARKAPIIAATPT